MTVRLKVVDGAEARPRRKHPPWLRVPFPGGATLTKLRDRVYELRLHRVCQSASCPNIGECWNNRALTIMILGNICTRSCRFCDVATGRPLPVDQGEPERVAELLAELRLTHTVITSVDRDDLDDGGAGHFAACIRETRRASPKTMVEVLVPDFRGNVGQVLTVVEAQPDVIAHNVETVERLTPKVRDPRAGYRQSLDVLRAMKTIDPSRFTKSSIMVGVGETEREVVETMKHLREVGCDFLTVGQYLQPTKKHLKVDAFIPPEQFEAYQAIGLELGFAYVASGPLVRSSYKAGEFFIRDYLQKHGDSRPA